MFVSQYRHSNSLVCLHRFSDRMLCDLPNVSESVYDLGTSTVILSLSLAAASQKESNIKFTYRHWNAVDVFFQLLDSAVISVVWAFL
jgi:hypothetical protein